MSADILLAIRAAGVELAIGETGNLKVTGDRIEVERWLPKIREAKTELLALLSGAEPPPLSPDDLALAFALLRHWGETDQAIGQEWIDGLAADPERLRQMYAHAVRLGLATYDPAPEAPETPETPAAFVTCESCAEFRPNRYTPTAGFGRCLIDAPASLRPPTLWPSAEHRCDQWRPTA